MMGSIPQAVIDERSKYDFATDAEYFYYRGKLAALKGIWGFIEGDGGTYRYLCYDCLDMDYMGPLNDGMQLSNWVVDNCQELEALRKGGCAGPDCLQQQRFTM